MRFFPLVFTLFMFILVVEHHRAGALHLHGDQPHHHHRRLALLVFLTVIVYGFYKNGLHFFSLFVPKRHPDLHPAADRVHRGAVVPVAADLAQRASVRQHAGRPHHAEGVRELRHAARRARHRRHRSAPTLPLALVVALTALELLVAFLQAYVFAILTCIYLNDAIHPGH